MANLLVNTLPKNNPIAIKIKLDTVINNVSLNPTELYNVTISPLNISDKTQNKTTLETIYNGISPYVKIIKLTAFNGANYWVKIYLPLSTKTNVIYVVPTVSDTTYQGGYRDLVSLTELSNDYITSVVSPDILSWSMALEYWIFNVLGFVNFNSATDTRPFPSKTTKLTKTIYLSIKGIDTNRSDESILTPINFTALMKTFGS